LKINSRGILLLTRYRDEIEEWEEILNYYKKDHANHLEQKKEPPPVLNSRDVMDYVDSEYLEFLAQTSQTTKKVDELIRTVNENTTFQAHFLQHKIHQARVMYQELDQDTELLYSKMLKASAERDRNDIAKINPAQVLSLISKQA
jgi:hypothetical protein